MSNGEELMNNSGCVSRTHPHKNEAPRPAAGCNTDALKFYFSCFGSTTARWKSAFFPSSFIVTVIVCPLQSVWQQYRRPHSRAVSSSQEAPPPAYGISIRICFLLDVEYSELYKEKKLLCVGMFPK